MVCMLSCNCHGVICDYYPMCKCVKGLSNWFCPSVSLSVCQSGEKLLDLKIDRFKWFPKLTVALTFKKKWPMCTSQEAKRFSTLCFSSSFLFNVIMTHHFNTVNTLDMVKSRYSWTWPMFITWWSPGIICTIVLTGLHLKTGELVHTSQSQGGV